MIKTRTELAELITLLKAEHNVMNTWMDSLPEDIVYAFTNNILNDTQSYLISHLLGKYVEDIELVDDIYWFLYEWDGDATLSYRSITSKEIEEVEISSITDFINYASEAYGIK